VLDIFPFGSAPFARLVGEFRRRIIEEAVAADLAGLVSPTCGPGVDAGGAEQQDTRQQQAHGMAPAPDALARRYSSSRPCSMA